MATEHRNVKGFKELAAVLDTLPEKMARNIIRSGMRAGAKPLKAEVERNAPVKSGKLKNSVKIGTGYRRGVVKATVKVGGKEAWYAAMVEFGTQAHVIRGKKGGPMYIHGMFTKSVAHPGSKAKPFVRPAMMSKAGDALRSAGEYIKGRLQEKDIRGLDRVDIAADDEGTT